MESIIESPEENSKKRKDLCLGEAQEYKWTKQDSSATSAPPPTSTHWLHSSVDTHQILGTHAGGSSDAAVIINYEGWYQIN